MLPQERRAAWSLSLIYMVRMLGLFIILPVFSLFADNYAHSTPFLIGLAIGIYGLLQAALQIPFGMLSDRIGRKKVVTLGLCLLALGSVVAALADSIYWVVVGRALQGAGAIAAALMALAADLTRDEQRTKVMAMLGASIGFSFLLALILGPLLIGWFSIDMLFWLTAVTALLGIVLLHTIVPNPAECRYSADTGARLATMRRLFRHGQLLRLDVSIFMLHLLITATFYVVPLALRDAGMASDSQWQIYLAAVVLSIAVMVPLIILAERRMMRGVLLFCIGGLLLTQVLFGFAAPTLMWLFVGITLFFCFLNTLEALLPSLVSRIAPAAAKGSAMGIYSSSQFFGAFVGGVGAGWLDGQFGRTGLFVGLALLCAVWGLLLLGFQRPRLLSTHRRALTAEEQARGDQLVDELTALPGVEEVVLAVDEGVAYMKVDKTRFQAAEA
jgi:MFS family permease